MYDMIKNPEDFFTHFNRYAVSVILTVLYGKRFPRFETEEATDFYDVQRKWITIFGSRNFTSTRPPANLEVRPTKMGDMEGQSSGANTKSETGVDCFMVDVLKNKEEMGMTRDMVAYLGGTLIEGGAETTPYFLQSFVLCYAAHPEVQRLAQEEMDRVVGENRIPTLEDYQDLPYLQAIIRETHRFRPIGPLGFPHAALEELTYGGYIIPKGSILYQNTWGIFHDPSIFDHPERFDPSRFIRSEYGTKEGADDQDFRHSLAFGGGRDLSRDALREQLNHAQHYEYGMVFKFGPSVDSRTGKLCPLDLDDYQKSAFTGPNPFKCSIVPRSETRVKIVQKEYADAIPMFERFEGHLDGAEKLWLDKSRANR